MVRPFISSMAAAFLPSSGFAASCFMLSFGAGVSSFPTSGCHPGKNQKQNKKNGDHPFHLPSPLSKNSFPATAPKFATFLSYSVSA